MTNWRGYGSPTKEQWRDIVLENGGSIDLASAGSWAAAGDHGWLALASLIAESSMGTRFNRNRKENKNYLNLRPPLRPDGTREPGDYMAFDTVADGIATWQERITSSDYGKGIYAKTETLDDLINVFAPRTDDNNPEEYVASIIARFNEWGVNGAQMIHATPCEIKIDVVDGPAVNRPAIPMPDASYVTVHEVGNMSPGADATMHRNFVHNGGGSNAVSFHFVVGYDLAYQLIYLNENAWHASDGYYGRGNRDTIAIETVQIGDFDKTLGNLAYLIAELYRNPNRFAWRSDVARLDDLDPALLKERTKQHNFWAPDKKNCPQLIRERGLWEPLLDAVAAELGDAAPELPRYAAPILPSWWDEKALIDLKNHREDGVLYKPLATRVTAIRETGAYAHPWLPEGKGKRVRANLQKGETVDLRYRVTDPVKGESWGITRFGTWIALKYFSPQIIIRNRGPE